MPRVVETQMWAKQREGAELVLCPNPQYRRIGLGGPRGGGKSTWTGRVHVMAGLAYPRLKSIILRMGTEDIIQNYKDQILLFLKELGASDSYKWLEGKHYFRGVNGSDIRLGFISKETDYGRYLGQEYGLISLTEAQEHTRKKWDDMGASNRAGASSYIPRMTADFNPGGVGQDWIEEMFVNPDTRPPHYHWICPYIWDCPSTLFKNPHYIKESLLTLPDWQMKQWLLGRFDALSGQYFVIPPHLLRRSVPQMIMENVDPREIAIPKIGVDWFGGVDYGDAKPFAVIFGAKWRDLWTGVEHLHFVREIYEANLYVDEQARLVKERETELRDMGVLRDEVIYYADPSVGRRVPSEREAQSKDIASLWRQHGFRTRPARTNNRVYGWKLMKMLYNHGILTVDPDCKAFLYESRTVVANGSPGPPIDEDIMQGTHVKDHALDSGRYMTVSAFPKGFQPPPPTYPTRQIPPNWTG